MHSFPGSSSPRGLAPTRTAILLDLDGTLTDNYTGIARSIRHALAALGAPEPHDEALQHCVGPPLRASFARLLATGDAALVERAIAHYRERYADVGWQENVPYDGITEMLRALVARGESLFLCTSKPALYAQRIAARFGLDPFLAGIYGADLAGTFDDKARLVAHLMAREGLEPAGSVMVGDRVHDLRAARANGLAALGVLWGYGSRDELAAADALVESPAGLVAALDALRVAAAQKSV
jgi:phosphoglycolate phosphatase